MPPTTDQQRPPTRWGWLIPIAAAAFLWVVVFFTLVVIVPVHWKRFAEYGMALPASTQLVLDVGLWFADFWWIVAPLFMPMLATAGVLSYLVWNHGQSRLLKAAWGLLLVGIPV